MRIKRLISNKVKEIKYGINNIFKWIPIIWRDRQWDHHYLHVVLRHKLILMRNSFRATSEEDAGQMDRCIKILDRIIAEDYLLLNDYGKSEELIEKDLDMLYTTIRKYIRGWWD